MRNAAAGNKKNRRKRPLTAAAAAAATAALALTALLSGCGKVGRPGAQFGEIIAAGRTAEAELVPYIHCPTAGEYVVAQGAATDGEFVYFLMRTSANGNGIICKYSLKTRKFAGQSEPIYVFHGNDMTYDSAKKLLYIAHGSTEGKILTAVDPDTLTVTEQSIDIEKGADAITPTLFPRLQIHVARLPRRLDFLVVKTTRRADKSVIGDAIFRVPEWQTFAHAFS